MTKGLHAWDATEVDHKVGVPKSRPALRQHHVRVARVDHLLRRKTHRIRRQKLSLFNVHDPPRMRRRDQQVRLSTEEGRDLQHVHKLRCQGRLMRLVNIRHGRDAQPLAHLAENTERPLVTDAREGINARSIRLAIRPLEDIRDTQSGRDLRHTLRNAQRHLLALNHARAGQEEELFCACQLIDVHCLSHSFDGLSKIISMSSGSDFPAPHSLYLIYKLLGALDHLLHGSRGIDPMDRETPPFHAAKPCHLPLGKLVDGRLQPADHFLARS